MPVAILLANTGTPASPTVPAVRRYLAQFLADPRIVDLPRWLWLPVLHAVILRLRPRRSARLYQKIWTPAGSPLLLNLQRQAEGLRQRLVNLRVEAPLVLPAMRYGEPSIPAALRQARAAGVTRLLLFPLFPQYSATTTASIHDAVFEELRSWRDQPILSTIRDYHDHPRYIDALARSLADHQAANGRSAHTLFSFHGIPSAYAERGDPYPAQCQRTASLLATAAGLPDGAWGFAFQSRFGPQPWLQPYTSETLAQLGARQLSSLDVLCPGFSSDCLETLEEIAVSGQETYTHAGGRGFAYIPALNDRPEHLDALAEIAMRSLNS